MYRSKTRNGQETFQGLGSWVCMGLTSAVVIINCFHASSWVGCSLLDLVVYFFAYAHFPKASFAFLFSWYSVVSCLRDWRVVHWFTSVQLSLVTPYWRGHRVFPWRRQRLDSVRQRHKWRPRKLMTESGTECRDTETSALHAPSWRSYFDNIDTISWPERMCESMQTPTRR